MKNRILLGFAALGLMMSNCSNEELNNLVVSNGNTSIKVAMEQPASSRASLDDEGVLSWTEGDAMKVYTTADEWKEFTYNTNSGEFEGTLDTDEKITGYAIYPSVVTPGTNAASVTLPVAYTLGEVTDNVNAIMLASDIEEGAETISLKHLGGVIRFSVKNVPAGASKLVFTADNTITGSFEIADGQIEAPETKVETGNVVTLNFTATDAAKDLVFYVPVPVGNYTMAVALYANDVLLFKKEGTTENDIARANLLVMPEVNCDDFWYDESLTEYTIKNEAQMKEFAEKVNSGIDFKGKTVKLGADLDLTDVEWIPIGINGTGKLFKGTFDGQEYTISNLSIDWSANTTGAGLFGYVPNPAVIKNLNIKNVNVKAQKYAGAIAGQLEENGTSRATIQGCNVDGGTITLAVVNGDNGNHAGGITGYASKNVTIEDCSVKNLTITAYKDMGGIAGTATGKTSSGHVLNIKNCTVTDVTFIQDLKDGYKSVNEIGTVGDIVGRIVNDALQTDGNTATGIEMTVKAYNQTDAQNALDLANTPCTIQLAAGTYGTLYIRWNEASELITSSTWSGGGHSYKRTVEGLVIEGVEGTEMTSLIAESGTYAGTAHSLSSTHTNLETIIAIEDMTIKGIEFNTGVDDIAVRFGVQGQHTSIDGLTIEDCVVNGTGTTSSAGSELFVCQLDNPDTKYGIDIVRKNVTIKDCEMNNLYQGLNIYYLENLTISRNKFNSIQARDMLFSCTVSGTGLTGTIAITGNTSDGAKDRFIRMARLNGTLSVTGNEVINYAGSDADMVKIDNSRDGAIISFSGNTWMGDDDATAKSNGKIAYDK